jgi:hypothetical protein
MMIYYTYEGASPDSEADHVLVVNITTLLDRYTSLLRDD